MAETLTKDVALALLGNTLPTGAILVVLITILGPISGAHFNPAVSLVFALKRELTPREALLLCRRRRSPAASPERCMAHAMFALPLLDASLKVRTGGAQWLAEGVAAFGLVATILAGIRFNRPAVPWLVGLYITAAYWFTSSTSFANPAVAIARSLTNTFSGIRPTDLPGFIAAELCGALVGADADGLAAAGGRRGRCNREGGSIMSVTIYHNPACGTSRNTLAMIRQSGEEPEVIEYLKNPPSRARLIELIKAMGISARALLREKGTPYAELGLADPKWSDDELIDFMLAHPILINRPIVVTPKGVRLCRPSELVLDLLDRPLETFVKEDGEVVVPAKP